MELRTIESVHTKGILPLRVEHEIGQQFSVLARPVSDSRLLPLMIRMERALNGRSFWPQSGPEGSLSFEARVRDRP